MIQNAFALALALTLSTALAAAEQLHVKSAHPARTYTQQLEITFATEAAARKASVAMTPLWDGRAWAISSRWDDNARGHVKTRDVLAKHGHKGTFYLNDPGRNNRGFARTGRKLLAGGNSIGGHSLSHPMLGYLNPNRLFEEVAGVRMRWEAALDTHVMSYAFSFCHFRNDLAVGSSDRQAAMIKGKGLSDEQFDQMASQFSESHPKRPPLSREFTDVGGDMF